MTHVSKFDRCCHGTERQHCDQCPDYPMCKGDMRIGTGCGKCSRCREQIASQQKSAQVALVADAIMRELRRVVDKNGSDIWGVTDDLTNVSIEVRALNLLDVARVAIEAAEGKRK